MRHDRNMRSSPSSVLLTFLATYLSSCPSTLAKPYPREVPFAEIAGSSLLRARGCANPCGWSGQVCCTAGQQCTTDGAGQAICSAGGSGVVVQGESGPGNNGQWQYYTTTWVETGLVTRVSTYSSYLGATAQAVTPTSSWAPVVTSQAQCSIPCGSICCANGQYCATAGQCAAQAAGGFSSSYYNSYATTYTSSSQTYIAPLRPTSGTVTTTTSTAGGVTATVPFQTPIGTAGNIVYGSAPSSSNKGLSGGAIAGIVIGILAALFLLSLICCLGSVRRILGGRRRREEMTYIRQHRHHRRHNGEQQQTQAGGRPWYGRGGPRRQGAGAIGGFGTIAAGLGTLALALGLKRKYDRRKEEASYSSGSDSGYLYSDPSTSESE